MTHFWTEEENNFMIYKTIYNMATRTEGYIKYSQGQRIVGEKI